MKKLIYHILVLTAICVVCSRCKHEVEPNPSTPCLYSATVGDVKDWYYFKVGTWKVFKEMNSGILDTVTVYESYESATGFDWYEHHSFGDWNIHFYAAGVSNCVRYPDCICMSIAKTKSRPGTYLGQTYFTFPHILGGGNGQQFLQRYSNQYYLDTLLFDEVVEWNSDNDDSERTDFTDFAVTTHIMAKGIGVIRLINETENFDWQLIAYEIVN